MKRGHLGTPSDNAICSNIINRTPVNFEQYRAVTLLFIENVISGSATHDGPLDEESSTIQTLLSQLNRLDCVTIDSQPFESEMYNGTLYRARPYLHFYYPRRKVGQLLDLFMYKNDHTLVSVYVPGANVVMHNDKLYTELSDNNGYIPLHQDFINGRWVDNFNTSFNPVHMKEIFRGLSLTNNALQQYGNTNLCLIVIVGMDFTNDMFTRLAHSAHSLFFA